ncbi:hypothetical protein C8R45DRAFT_1078377 [Mycena sanguinolenta]|nr:hypothetical protein C8R45DRAFT_1078377 [Mycena sanguinolenta]
MAQISSAVSVLVILLARLPNVDLQDPELGENMVPKAVCVDGEDELVRGRHTYRAPRPPSVHRPPIPALVACAISARLELATRRTDSGSRTSAGRAKYSTRSNDSDVVYGVLVGGAGVQFAPGSVGPYIAVRRLDSVYD